MAIREVKASDDLSFELTEKSAKTGFKSAAKATVTRAPVSILGSRDDDEECV